MHRRSFLEVGVALRLTGMTPPVIVGCQSQPNAPRASSDLGCGFHLGEVLRRPSRDFDDMAAAGATTVRFGIALREQPAGTDYVWPQAALEELDRTLIQAARVGMRVVLVLRPKPEPDSRLWQQLDLQNSLNDIWKALARSLRDHRQVAAFDLVNEPHPSGLTFAAKERSWAELAHRLIQTIRAEDPSRTIVYEPSPGARPMAFRTVQALPFENIVYSVHYYEPFEFTHQRIGDPRFTDVVDFPSVLPRAAGYWDDQRLLDDLSPVRDFEARSGRPIYVGEFGAIRWAPPGSRERYLSASTALFNQQGWSWSYHAFREWHGWDAEMGSDKTNRSRSSSEAAFKILQAALRAG